MGVEQSYYDMLTRNDHPVFAKIFDDVTTFDEDTPFNMVLNLLVAKQMCRFRDAKLEVVDNQHPHTVRESGIDRWEDMLFGFTKGSVSFTQRRDELVARFNEVITMSVPDVILLAQQIVGVTPIVIRNAFADGWTLDVASRSVLDISTILPGDDQAGDSQLYLVIFNDPVDSTLLQRLDEELTIIEKAGSRHIISSPPTFWILDQNTIGVDTILG